MNNNKQRSLKLFGAIAGSHIVILFILWLLLNSENIEEPVFEKIISVKLTTTPPAKLPPINQQQRDKIAEEKRQKEEAERKRQKDLARKKRQEAERKRKANEEKKRKEKDLAAKNKTKLEKEKEKKRKAELERKRKADEEKKRKAELERKRKADEEKKRKAELERKRKADEAERKRQYAREQASFGKHVTSDIVNQISKEWNKLLFSQMQFSKKSETVTISITVRKNGSVVSAGILKRSSNQALNSQAQKLINLFNSGNYRFPAFPRGYAKTSMTIKRSLSVE